MPRKSPIQTLINALQQRLHHIVAVIDDALHSEQLKDRIWAVEQLFKRLKLEDLPASHPKPSPTRSGTPKTEPPLSPAQLANLSDAELEARLLQLLHPNHSPSSPSS